MYVLSVFQQYLIKNSPSRALICQILNLVIQNLIRINVAFVDSFSATLYTAIAIKNWLQIDATTYKSSVEVYSNKVLFCKLNYHKTF